MEEKICSGCGAILQTLDENKDGYVDPKALNRENILCKRCFQLQHYGKFVKGNETFSTIKMVHESVNKDDVVILLVDVCLTIAPLVSAFSELKKYKKIYVLANRYDLYQNYINEQKTILFLKRELDKFGLKYIKIFILKDNIEEIFNEIIASNLSKNLCFIGLENVGKTTLINKFLKTYRPDIKQLTNSLYPGTTLQPLKIELNEKNYLLDTPGIKSKNSFINKVENKVLKLMQLDRKITQTSYQLNSLQSVIVNNFMVFDYQDGIKQTISFYLSDMLILTRCKLENSNNTFNSLIKDYKIKTNKVHSIDDFEDYIIEIKDNCKHDIVIEGLGFLSVMNSGKFRIRTFKDMNIYIRKAMI